MIQALVAMKAQPYLIDDGERWGGFLFRGLEFKGKWREHCAKRPFFQNAQSTCKAAHEIKFQNVVLSGQSNMWPYTPNLL